MKTVVAAVVLMSLLHCRPASASEDLHELLQRRDVSVEAGVLGLAVWTLREGKGELARCFSAAYFASPGAQYYFLTSAWLSRAKDGYLGLISELERQCVRGGEKQKWAVEVAAWTGAGEPHSLLKERDRSALFEGIVGVLTAYTGRHDRKLAECLSGVSWASPVLGGTGGENTEAAIAAVVDGLRSECVPGSLVGSPDPALPGVPSLEVVAGERLLASAGLKECDVGTFILNCMMAHGYRREEAIKSAARGR